MVFYSLFASFGKGDIASVLNALSPEIEWSVRGPADIPYAGTRRGREQVARFFAALGDAVEFQQFEPQEFIAQDDQVVVLGCEKLRVKATGQCVENQWVMVFTVRGGRVIRFREFNDTASLAAGFRSARASSGIL